MADEPPAAESSSASITGYAGKEFGSGQFFYLLKSCITGGAGDEQILLAFGYHLRVLQIAGRALKFVYRIGAHGLVSCILKSDIVFAGA
jgi:hypothetical protein